MPTSTRTTTPFDARSTADEVIAGTDLTGRSAVVTGASSGIGVETARALAGAGARVTLAVRDTDAGERVAERIRAETGLPHPRGPAPAREPLPARREPSHRRDPLPRGPRAPNT